MSDTRPPITAGPIDRAFRFLKSASLSGTGDAEGLAEGDGASCADEIEIAQLENNSAQKYTSRIVIRRLPSRSMVVGQAHRLPWQAERLPYNCQSLC